MAIVGYCHDCGAWVNVAGDWSCPSGHSAERVNGWYESTTGQSVVPAATDAATVAAPATPSPGTRTGFLTDLMTQVANDHGYSAEWGSDTDMILTSNPVDSRWGAGHKRAEYSAALKVVEDERAVYFWEMLKERGHGVSFGTIESETYSTSGAKRSGTKHEATVGPGSASWEWGHGTLRKLVEEVAARHGLTVRVVFARRSAIW